MCSRGVPPRSTKVLRADDTVTIWGTGEERRDLLHVDDLVDCVSRSLNRQRDPFLLVNVGSGQAVSIRSLVESIVRIAGLHLDIKHDLDQPTIPTSLCLDCTLAQQELGWQPRIDLEEGIRRTITWYRENLL